MELSELAEEVATFYAKMLEHDYTKKEIFNKNFFEDWRKEMTDEERKKIKKLEKCNFQEMCDFFKEVSSLSPTTRGPCYKLYKHFKMWTDGKFDP